MTIPTESDVINALSRVMDPELGRNLVELQMIRNIKITSSGAVSFMIALTIPGCPLREKISADAKAAVLALPGVKNVTVNLGAMTEEERKAVLGKNQSFSPKLNEFNQVNQVIAVMSGKGGVGKSSVTALLAASLACKGKRVGVLDADITGPSIPRMFGLAPGGVRGSQDGMLPGITARGIKVISVNLLLPEEDMAVIWRGPMISGTIQQFWNQTLWGQLDTLLVDLPPGTSDASLTVLQSLPVNGVLLVTTPQGLASMVVRKAVSMLQQMKVPILGVVENMSYYICPDTGKKHAIFGESHASEIAEAAGVKVWARLPINPQITALCDAGKVEEADLPEIEEIVKLLG
jgi:ATP-binding protein involved in chromosome partitioning